MAASNLGNTLIEIMSLLAHKSDKLIVPKLPKAAKPLLSLAKSFGFDLDAFLLIAAQKLEDMPDEYWYEVEDCIQGILDGEPEAKIKLIELIEGKPYEYHH